MHQGLIWSRLYDLQHSHVRDKLSFGEYFNRVSGRIVRFIEAVTFLRNQNDGLIIAL
jgi:hypothetical protein